MTRILFVLVFLSVVLVSGIHGCLLPALGSWCLLLLLVSSAFPVCVWLFGEVPAVLALTLPVGYIIHSVVLICCARFIGIDRTTITVYAGLMAGATAWNWKRYRIIPRLLTGYEYRVLGLWLLLMLAAVSLPLAKVGISTENGFAYRAYFSADFFKDLSVTAALAHTGIPPENPYLAGNTLHYYWFFYVIPAYWIKLFRSYPLQFLMVQFTLFSAIAFTGGVFAVVRRYSTQKLTTLLVLPVFLFGGSYEGVYCILRLWREGHSWKGFTHYNLDGITRWFWNTPQADTLYRALLYAPQHLMALCAVLIYLCARDRAGTFSRRTVLYALVFSSLGFGAVIGTVVIAVTLVILSGEFLLKPRERVPWILAAGAVGVLFLALYFPVLSMFRLEGGEFRFGFVVNLWKHLIPYLVLNWGAILILAAAGIFYATRTFPIRMMVAYAVGSVFCMHFVADTIGGNEVTLKLGYFVALSFLLLAAGFVDRVLASRIRPAAILAGLSVLLAPAMMTWAMDMYNNQDVRNDRFTTYILPDDAEVLGWIRSEVEPGAVVQGNSVEGTELHHSVLAPFSEHPVCVGDDFHAKAFQVSDAEVVRRQNYVRSMFHDRAPANVHATARYLGIQYVFVGAEDPAYEIRNNLKSPYFSLLTESGKAAVYRVNEVKDPARVPLNVDLLRVSSHSEVLLEAVYDQHFYDPEVGVSVDRWMGEDGVITFHADHEMGGLLQMTILSFLKPRHVEFYLHGNLIYQQEAIQKGTEVEFPIVFPEGETQLLVHCPEGAESTDRSGARMDARQLSLRIRALRFQLQQPDPSDDIAN